MSSNGSSTGALALSTTLNISGGTFYFSYGSNMWLHQMAHRCPQSKYLGIARLPNYRWIINARGSANIVQISDSHNEKSKEVRQPLEDSISDAVWGLVYYLQPADESYLDIREHVPNNFTKEMLPAQFWPSKNMCKAPFDSATEYRVDVAEESPKAVNMLVYINRMRTTEDVPRDEYIVRMNEGISDALKAGVPEEYVCRVIRKFISE